MPLTALHQELQPLDVERSGTPFDMRNVREYVKKFRVVMVYKTSDVIEVCACPGLPIPFSSYYSISEAGVLVYDLYALMVRMSAETDQDNPFLWIVTCEYSTEMPDGGAASFPGYPTTVGGKTAGGAANNPELEPPELLWDGEVVQEAPSEDLDGKPYWNSADQPFAPAPTFPVCYPILTLTRNELYFNTTKANDYSFAVNSLTFLDAPPGSVQCMPIVARQQYRGLLAYARVTYKFKFQQKYLDEFFQVQWRSWQPRLLNNGLCYKDLRLNSPTFGKPVPISRFGSNITQPVALTESGQELDLPGGPDTNNPDELQATYSNFRQYQERDFNQLLLNGVK